MSLLGNGDSLPFSEAKNMELLLLKETKKPSVGNPHGKKASKGILSSLFKSAQVSGGEAVYLLVNSE